MPQVDFAELFNKIHCEIGAKPSKIDIKIISLNEKALLYYYNIYHSHVSGTHSTL